MSSRPGEIPAEITKAMGAEPTDEQWHAISMPLEPYVLVAGAGSGKTSVMAARVVYLALVALGRIEDAGHDGVLPGNVLCLTFTNKATENLTARVRRALLAVELQEGEEPEILNYHGFAARILERHGMLAGVEPNQRILTPAQRTELCAKVLDRMTFDYAKAGWQPSLIDNILSLADQMANHRRSAEEVIAFNEDRLEKLKEYRSDAAYVAALERIELARAAEAFVELKRELGVIDFGDQIQLALQVIEGNPAVGEEYRARFRAALLDEYQDTDVAQSRLIAGVFGNGFPVTAVGDPDQNIYAWRGASVFNLFEFPAQFPRADGTRAARLPLYTNFRSGANILAAADTIIRPLPDDQRPDPAKQLTPWPANGDGAVHIVRFADEWSEAGWIAGQLKDLHTADTAGAEGAAAAPWSSFAVLCRSSRQFFALQQAFAEQEIPAEFVDLAGLLSLPEIVEVLSYARAVANPFASVALARILLGPRYRVGFKDLALVAGWAKTKNYALRDQEDGESEAQAFLFAEALEHLDEVEGLSEEARSRLDEFRTELAELRAEARRPVGEFLAEVIRRTGLLAELDAELDRDLAAATKRNLAAFLDQVHEFSPVEGELTLGSFLDYVDAVEQIDKPEWSPVQPSEADSVKVMTIHKAKGLEFDTVFVPGFALDLLPTNRLQHNPSTRGKSLDFELRGDARILPRFDGVLKTFKEALKQQELIEERRTCYVALTRARKRLFATGAWWYGETQKPKKASVFFDELADWGETSGRASVDRGPAEPAGDENPLFGYRERFVRPWPGPAARPGETDTLFPDGWRKGALNGEQGTLDAALVDEAGRDLYQQLRSERTTLAAHILEREAAAGLDATDRRADGPRTVSVSNLITYATCPKKFFWTTVRPLPQFSGPAARIGTRVHAWIERRAGGQTSLLENEESPDFTSEELAGEPGKIERLEKAFLESRFATVTPLYAERPFLLMMDGLVVNGRIDAIYGDRDGPWEIVDYKTGRVPPEGDPLAGLQLDLYALACVDVFGKSAEDLTLTYLYLSEAAEVTSPAGDIDEIRGRVADSLKRIAAGEFDPAPGPQCGYCDFLSFCEEGKAHVSSARSGGETQP